LDWVIRACRWCGQTPRAPGRIRFLAARLDTGLPGRPFTRPVPRGLNASPLPYYVAARTGTAVLVTGLLVLVYLIGRRLHGGRVALISALLLAFDPPMLGYSRLVHMSCRWHSSCFWRHLLAALANAAALALAHPQRSFLRPFGSDHHDGPHSASSAGPHCAGGMVDRAAGLRRTWWSDSFRWLRTTLWHWLWQWASRQLPSLSCGAAMWMDPGRALRLSFEWLWLNANAGFGNWGMYWMGQTVLDPGPAFYPLGHVAADLAAAPHGSVASLITFRRSTPSLSNCHCGRTRILPRGHDVRAD